MAGKRRVDRDLGGLAVADLADHDHVGVLAQDGAQPAGEGDARLGVHLELVHAHDLVFHGVLNGHDIVLLLVQGVDACIERGGLAASRGARDKDHAVGPLDEPLIPPKHVRRKMQPFQVLDDLRAVEDAHHHGLALDHGQRRNAEVHRRVAVHAQGAALPKDRGDHGPRVAVRDPGLEPAVLGHALLGDVHVGQDLDARHDGRVHLALEGLHLPQHAVDAVPDLDGLPLRHDMDVAGPLHDGLGDHHAHELHHRSVLGHHVGDHARLGLYGAAGKVHDRVVDGHGNAVQPVDGAHDVAARGHYLAHFPARGLPDIVDPEDIERVCHGHDNGLLVPVEGNGREPPRHGSGDQPHRVGVHQLFVDLHVGYLELPPQEGGQIVLREKPEVHQELADLAAPLLLLLEGLLELFFLDEPAGYEHLAEHLFLRVRGSHSFSCELIEISGQITTLGDSIPENTVYFSSSRPLP